MGNNKTSVEDLLLARLSANSHELWLSAWRRVALSAFGGYVVQHLDLDAGRVLAGLSRLDDPMERGKLLPQDSALEDRCLAALLEHMGTLNTAVTGGGYKKRTRPGMSEHLRKVLPGLMSSLINTSTIVSNPFPELWRVAADLLAARAHAAIRSAGRGNAETRLQNQLLLSAYFASCQLPEARLVEEDLKALGSHMMSVRGSLLRIVENLSEHGVADRRPPCSPRGGGITLRHAHLSDLLRATSDESQHVADGKGVMHRIVPVNAQFDIPHELRGQVTDDQVRQGRDIVFRQYEYTILAYMALASLEQLLRAWASKTGVLTGGIGARPNGVLSFLDKLGCSPGLEARVRELYDSERSNIRNRIMHGGLLEVESKRQEVLLAVVKPTKYPSTAGTARDEYAPENICQICFECLELLDTELAAATSLTPADLQWANHYWLSPKEVETGQKVYCEFLGPDALKWQQYLSQYLNAVVPSVKQFFSIGFLGWIGNPQPDTLVRFMAMVLIFEALYRSTVQLYGVRTLQVVPNGSHVQYRMLDEQQLCTPTILDMLTQEITPHQRPVAKEVYELAVKIRNALAHGAVVGFDAYTADGAGHLIVKAVQGLVGGGLHAMTKEAAYYHWRNVSKCREGTALNDWTSAERQLLRMVAQAAQP